MRRPQLMRDKKILKGRRFQSWWCQDFEISYKEKFLSPKQNCFENSMVTHLKDIFLCSLSFNTFKRFCDGSHACAPLCIKESEKARRQDLPCGPAAADEEAPFTFHRKTYNFYDSFFTMSFVPDLKFKVSWVKNPIWVTMWFSMSYLCTAPQLYAWQSARGTQETQNKPLKHWIWLRAKAFSQ